MNKAWVGIWTAVAALLTTSSIHAQNQVCIPTAGVPTMDGQVASDPGWNGAGRVDLDLSGVVPQVYARLVRTATHVYIGLSVNTPPLAPTSNDRIVICLSTSDAQAAWRIHIQPYSDSVSIGQGQAAFIEYWRNSSTWKGNVSPQNPSDPAAPAPWLQTAQVPTFFHGLSFWEMELKIPIESNLANDDLRTGVYFPPIGTSFKLYFNILRVSGAGYAFQYPWKSSSKIDPTLLSGTPEPTAWASGSFDQKATSSIILVSSKLGLVAPPCPSTQEVSPYTPSQPFGDCAALSDDFMFPTTGPSNTFFATLRNKMASTAHIKSAFDVSDFGLPAPADWWPVGYPPAWPAPLTNPGSAVDLLPDLEGTATLDWPLTYKQSCQLAVAKKSIRATLSRSAPDETSLFYANPVVRSLNTCPASVFESDARVGTKGYPAPASGKQAFVLTVGKQVVPRPVSPRLAPPPAPGPGRTPVGVAAAPAAAANPRGPTPDAMLFDEPGDVAYRSFAPDVEETFLWVCRGFRNTGRTFVLDDRPKKLTVADTDAVGAFGYLAGHRGPVERWTSEFTGPGLRSTADGVFELEVSQDRQGLVHTRIEAESFNAWALRARVGLTVPHKDYADLVDAGWSELVSLEYRLDAMFSIEARLGVASFDGESGGPDVYVVQHAINARATLLEGPFRPFVNIGPGFFANNPGDDGFGANVGLGAGWRISDRFAVEAALDHFHVFAHGENPHFSTLQLGVGLKF
jgi:hypothetical protein